MRKVQGAKLSVGYNCSLQSNLHPAELPAIDIRGEVLVIVSSKDKLQIAQIEREANEKVLVSKNTKKGLRLALLANIEISKFHYLRRYASY